MLGRKDEHIDICLKKDVNSKMSHGFDEYSLQYNALPEVDYDSIDIKTDFMGRTHDAPLMISAITGGTVSAKKINNSLFAAAQELNLPIGVGSQRAQLKGHRKGFDVRTTAPDAMIFANLGAVQLNYGMSLDDCQRAVDMIRADALVLHLNPLQEAIQPEGDRNFAGLQDKMADVVSHVSVPVIVKEVGLGISAEVACRLEQIGVKYIDIGGAGGTSFAVVESYRRGAGPRFAEYGIPTAQALEQIKKKTGQSVIASGGIRTGTDIVKALCLGADMTGMARPLLVPAKMCSTRDYLKGIIEEIKLAMFSIGAQSSSDLNPNKVKMG